MGVVEKIVDNTVHWADASVFHDLRLRSILTATKFAELAAAFKKEWLEDVDASVDRFRRSYSSTDQAGLYRGFKEALEHARTFSRTTSGCKRRSLPRCADWTN